MVVTEVWLEVKNGRTIVLDGDAVRVQKKRWHNKRKPTSSAKNRKKKRRRNDSGATESNSHAMAGLRDNTEDSGDVDGVRHENLQLFADAQEQLQQEMHEAGVGGDELPLSFGSTSSQTASRPRKRQRNHFDQDTMDIKPAVVAAAHVEPAAAAPVEKVHVTFDSDGEVAERTVETVSLLPAPITNDSAAAELEDGEAIDTQPQGDDEDRVELVEEQATTVVEEPDVDPTVLKFWKQRRTLFHKYDEGIQLDRESWYSVTPEAIADYIAKRCACDVLVDPFSGCGGNIIQFAKTCKQVIAIEIDADKIAMAKQNAAIYGVADRIEWIHGDALAILPLLKADVVFLSPPWGGMNYNRDVFAIDEMVIGGKTTGTQLFEMARRVAKNVVYYLPKTTPESDLQALAASDDGELVECEHIHLNGQLKVVNAYYGEIAFQKTKEAAVNESANSTNNSSESPREETADPSINETQ